MAANTPRFVITHTGDTHAFVALLVTGDAQVLNKNGVRFVLPARTIAGIR